MKIILTVTIVSLLILSTRVFADDGTYNATVTTDSGSYTVPVEVENGEVTIVHWPDGGDMNVYGAEIEDGEASGTNSNGDIINIQIDDYSNSSDEGDQEEQ